MNYWLMKSEPDNFSIDDLEQRPLQTEPWNGVRNYQARNMMRDAMQPGDLIFFYHSNCAEPGIVGIMEVAKTGYPDDTALDPDSPYFDPKSSAINPRWFMVDVRFVRRFSRTISLKELKTKSALTDFTLLRPGNRLSIMPVEKAQWDFILTLETR
jgi:predicted RNA-binding protein with PUA-like domain